MRDRWQPLTVVANQWESNSTAINEMNVLSYRPLLVPFISGRRDIMAGRDKRMSLHFLFPAEIINQNRNGILMRIMEISVNIKYLGKPRSDCSNSQACFCGLSYQG